MSLIRKWRGEAAEDPAGGEAKKKAKKGHDVAKGFSAWVKAKLDRKTLVRRLLTNSFPIFATLLLLSPGFSSWADFTFILGSLAMVVVTVYFLIWVGHQHIYTTIHLDGHVAATPQPAANPLPPLSPPSPPGAGQATAELVAADHV